MINAVIIEDKAINAKTLQAMVRNYCPSVNIVGIAGDIDSAFAMLRQHMPDLAFLDIEMLGGSGFDLLRKFDPVPFEVIFTTAYNQYAIEAFQENVLDYLLKPINISNLQRAVAKVEKQVALKKSNEEVAKHLRSLQKLAPGKISLPTIDGYLFIAPQEIIRCEASGSYSNFYMSSGKKIVVSMLLKKCEDLLPSALFLRIHNSHIINLQFVQQYIRGRGGYIVMQDGSRVDVAASRKQDFLDAMSPAHSIRISK
ncbi:LytR/AlgR family response regulator transcription factor [Taibaiella koreensis]|uniref:LytR/AlgR family response regulator transcription factor n=1 Tax=Taibaiella koreensis TaxID=1268548 RepID=UPI000E59E452|nr:LytTR family DNA-binding domain-containing protein [Taibaiella koreensis]